MTDSDWDLVRRCQAAEGAQFEEAYRELYALYKNRVYTVCLRVTGNEEDALDAAQETLVTIARRIKDFAFRSRFSSWVYRIAVNAAIDVRRRRLSAPKSASNPTLLRSADRDSFLEPVAPEDSADPVTRVAAGEAQEAIRQALANINPKFSELLVLRYIADYSYEEIAKDQNCNLGTVKSRLNRAHAALRDYLSLRGMQVMGEP